MSQGRTSEPPGGGEGGVPCRRVGPSDVEKAIAELFLRSITLYELAGQAWTPPPPRESPEVVGGVYAGREYPRFVTGEMESSSDTSLYEFTPTKLITSLVVVRLFKFCQCSKQSTNHIVVASFIFCARFPPCFAHFVDRILGFNSRFLNIFFPRSSGIPGVYLQYKQTVFLTYYIV